MTRREAPLRRGLFNPREASNPPPRRFDEPGAVRAETFTNDLAVACREKQQGGALVAIDEVNGLKLFYELVGDGDPVVLVHGSWGDHHVWDLVSSGLAARSGF